MNPYAQQQKQAREDALMARCLDLIKRGQRVEAVRAYRAAKGCSLKDALKALER